MKQHSSVHLIVVAHPDDETLFFAGLILKNLKKNWKIVCVTDGNADGNGELRKKEFLTAATALGVKNVAFYELKDKFEARLDTARLISLLKQEKPAKVYTHGILGEYGHPHHQDVSYSVHHAFPKKIQVMSVAYNCYPDEVVVLTPKTYSMKSKLLSTTYFSETVRFSFLLPATFCEGFVKVSPKEVDAVYAYFIKKQVPKKNDLKKYRWFLPYFEAGESLRARPF